MKSAFLKKTSIFESGASIAIPLEVTDANYLSDQELTFLLKSHLIGLSTANLPLRSRSKFVKSEVCKAIGYSVPATFKKTQPRFLCQNFDIYVQKSNNLQIWNEKVASTRRYVIILVSHLHIITNLKVINGDELAQLDKTGTLTQKYQARIGKLINTPELFSTKDSANISSLLGLNIPSIPLRPTDPPQIKFLLPLDELANRLSSLIGFEFEDTGYDQDRNRGGILHKVTCQQLGYKTAEDNGKFPDILNQLIEVKLQMSPTIDLGLVKPDTTEPFLKIGSTIVRHCDVRYLIFLAERNDNKIKITNFALGYGIDFFNKFTLFEGKKINKKIQIPLPKSFFND